MLPRPKSYCIEKPSPTVTIYTSWAFLLTAEGLENPSLGPLFALLLKFCIEDATDEEFIEAFDGATKEQAWEHLRAWELCWMPHWGSKQLVNVICWGEGRDRECALDSIELAQEVKELPKVFTPKQGVLWAMNNGYLVTGTIRDWLNVDQYWYGHPHSILNTSEREESIRGKTDDDFEAPIRDFIDKIISKFPEATSKDIISHCFSCYLHNNRKKNVVKEIMSTMNIEMDKSAGKRSQESIDYLKNAPTYKQHLS